MRKKRSLTGIAILAVLITALALTGCGSDSGAQQAQTELVSRDFEAMDTYMTVSSYGDGAEAALEECENMIAALEDEVSTEKPDSQIAKLNASGETVLTGDSLTLVSEALDLYRDTDGAFNISIYPIMKAWGFTTKEYRVPSDQELEELLKATDLSTVDLDADSGKIAFGQEGMEIDLGGITKGRASAKCMEIMKKAGLAGGMVNLGGNVQVFGKKPDGSLWRVAVQSPHETDEYLGILEMTDKAMITSGGYERFFEQDGKTYHHIMDPSTGRPAESGLISATIVSDDGTLADGLSTSLYVMGRDRAVSFWQAHKNKFDFILMTDDDELYVTEPIADSFTTENYHVNVVR